MILLDLHLIRLLSLSLSWQVLIGMSIVVAQINYDVVVIVVTALHHVVVVFMATTRLGMKFATVAIHGV